MNKKRVSKLITRDEQENIIFDSKYDTLKIFSATKWTFTAPAENVTLDTDSTTTYTTNHGLGFVPLVFPAVANWWLSPTETAIEISGMGDRTLPLMNTGGEFYYSGQHLTLSADTTKVYARLYRFHSDFWYPDPFAFPACVITINLLVCGNVIHEIDYDDIIT